MSTHSTDATLRGFSGHLLLVGAGKMGHALLEGWLGLGLDPQRILVFEPQPAPDLAALAARGLRLNPPHSEARGAEAIVIAVKPQIAGDVVPPLAPLVGNVSVAISIMAGKPLQALEQALPGAAIVRAMPNTPAAVGRGMTVALANQRVSPAQRDLAHALLSATGAVEWISEEALMDAVTAVSGSGPAYVFLLAEALAQAGIDAGLPPDLAAKLARETVAGSGELLRRSALDPATLRQNVTSPGGTTEAALAVLMGAEGLASLMTNAVAAATRRSRALAR
jgi:pyrroline-5-carboxylate reductase